jgi:hypothetical protein
MRKLGVICWTAGLLSGCAGQAPTVAPVVECPKFQAPATAIQSPARTDYVEPAKRLRESLERLERSLLTAEQWLSPQ